MAALLLSTRLRRLGLAVVGLAVGIVPAGLPKAAWAAVEAIVVASTAPGVVMGQRLATGQPVSLPAGSSTVFLLSTGRMIEIPGPFTGPLLAPESSSQGLLTQAALALGRDMSSLGGARLAGSGGAEVTGDVVVPVERSGELCLRRGDRLFLHRAQWRGAATLRIEDAGTGAVHPVEWPDGVARIAWPDAVAVHDGMAVRLHLDGAPNPAEIRLRVLDSTAVGPAWIAVLLTAGCAEQGMEKLAELRDHAAPFGLFLATDRGPDPVYRAGDPITFRLQTNRDAYLYCYVQQADGVVVPVFPASARGGAHVSGHTPVTIPGERLPIQFRATESRGDDRMRCFAADRDVTAELPPDLVNPSFKPLPPRHAAGLDSIFRRLRHAELAEAEVAIRVE